MPSGATHSESTTVQGTAFDSFIHGRGAVAVAGTAVALSTAAIARGGDFTGDDRTDWHQSVVVKAPVGNTGSIFVGGSAVSSANGFELEQGASIALPLRDIADIFVDAANNGDEFVFIAIL